MSFLTGHVSNPEAGLATQYGQAYSQLLGGGGNDPFSKLFQTELGPTLAQAKESAGNLTGTGLTDTLGTAAGRSLSSFLLSVLGQGQSLASVGAQPTYTPGFLDYLFQGAGAAAPFIAGLNKTPSAGKNAAAGNVSSASTDTSGPGAGDILGAILKLAPYAAGA